MTLFPYTDDDFSDMPSPSSLSLNIVNTRGCVSIGITNDNIVEGTEMFLVHFIETDDNQITIAGSNTTSVFIEDDEGNFPYSSSTLNKYFHTFCFHSNHTTVWTNGIHHHREQQQ